MATPHAFAQGSGTAYVSPIDPLRNPRLCNICQTVKPAEAFFDKRWPGNYSRLTLGCEDFRPARKRTRVDPSAAVSVAQRMSSLNPQVPSFTLRSDHIVVMLRRVSRLQKTLRHNVNKLRLDGPRE